MGCQNDDELGGKDLPDEVIVDKKIVNCQIKTQPTGLDPLTNQNAITTLITSNIFEGLLKFKESSTEVEPALAKSFEVNDENTEYVFNLRKNVFFHDGDEFNALAVLKNFERIKNEALSETGYINTKKFNESISSVEKIDDYTIKITLKYPYTPFLSDLAMNIVTPMISPNIIENTEELKSKPVGTGPFKFVKWREDKDIVIEKNLNYWGKNAEVDQINFKLDALSDSKARELLNRGEIDIIDIKIEKDSSNSFKYKSKSLLTTFIALNSNKPPFDNKEMRKAVAMSLDRQELFDKYFGGSGTFANTFIPPEIPGHNSQLNFYPFNINEANKIVTSNKNEEVLIIAIDTYFQNQALYQDIITSLKRLGLEVTFNNSNLNDEDLSYAIKNGNYHMLLAGWQSDNGDPDNYMGLFSSLNKDSNISNYKNEEVDRLIKLGITLQNGQERYDTYKDIQRILEEDAILIPLYHEGRTYGLSSRIKNFRVHPTGNIIFKNIDVE